MRYQYFSYHFGMLFSDWLIQLMTRSCYCILYRMYLYIPCILFCILLYILYPVLYPVIYPVSCSVSCYIFWYPGMLVSWYSACSAWLKVQGIRRMCQIRNQLRTTSQLSKTERIKWSTGWIKRTEKWKQFFGEDRQIHRDV